MDDRILSIELERDAALVLYEAMASEVEASIRGDAPTTAEIIAKSKLVGLLERQMAEMFAPNYQAEVAAAGRRLVSRFAGTDDS